MAAWGCSEIKHSFRETYTDELKEGKFEIWAQEKWKLIRMHVGRGGGHSKEKRLRNTAIVFLVKKPSRIQYQDL